MNFELIAYQHTNASISQFWKAITVLLNNIHTINRRILVCKRLLLVELKSNDNIYLFAKQIQSKFDKEPHIDDAGNLFGILQLDQHSNKLDLDYPIEACDNKVCLHINKLLPRNSKVFSTTIEYTFLNKQHDYVLCLHKCNSVEKQSLNLQKAYKIQYEKNGIVSISIQKTHNISCEKGENWLKQKLLPRLIKWMINDHVNNNLPSGSLSFVSPEKYAKLYESLKNKYGASTVAKWPENTDPAKFVYEDIAIATYLLLLWENERNEKETDKLQSFLDLGCGNGLLVHILSNEGYTGLGMDLRKRKIWDIYPKSTCLQVHTIVPSSNCLFPDIDWLIGNHSDELTPWIPVIAARSSYNCRFFLLPCCAYEFDGRKYQRHNASNSQYSDYISYIKSICEECGFHTQIDRLRIPSTKRICLIGQKRNYSKEFQELQDKQIQEIINARSLHLGKIKTNDSNSENPSWCYDFKSRNPIEETRNCTRLDKNIIMDIIKIVSVQLLSIRREIFLEETPKVWNAGGQINLGDIAKIIPSELLKQLKNECGGIQTLLKNNGHIFAIVQGKVQFRIPGATSANTSERRKINNSMRKVKVKPCWFHENHPDGCPSPAVKCNFKH